MGAILMEEQTSWTWTIISILILFTATVVIVIVNIIQTPWKDCKGIAILCKQYYNVYLVKEETDTNYEFYYKSIKVKETKEAYYTIMVDWKTETEQEYTFDKNQYVVVVSY